MNTVTIIISSGLVSGLMTILVLTLWLGQYKQKVDATEKHIDKHDNRIMSLSERVAKLEGGIDRDREYIQKKSPLSLTEKGKAVLLDSTGKDYVDTHKEQLIELIRVKNPKTAYDVQEFSKVVIQESSNDDDFKAIKDFVFKQGLRLELIVDILGIYLRDLALPRLGFNIADIKD